MRHITLLKTLITKLFSPRLLLAIKKKYYVYAVQFFSEADTEPIKCLVKPGDYVVDIGANIGWYTRILAGLVTERGRVYSIEPILETFEILSSVIEKLVLKNVQLFNCALSEKDGWDLMQIPLYDYGGQNFYQAKIVGDKSIGNSARQCKVHLRSIDSLFRELPKNITFIKCDVEGHELSVIKGSSNFLAKCRPAWLIEVSGNPDDDNSPSNELFNWLKEANYTAYWFDGRRLNQRSRGDRATNYFFLQPSHMAELGQFDGAAEKNGTFPRD